MPTDGLNKRTGASCLVSATRQGITKAWAKYLSLGLRAAASSSHRSAIVASASRSAALSDLITIALRWGEGADNFTGEVRFSRLGVGTRDLRCTHT